MALFLSGIVSPVVPGSSTTLTLSRSTLVTDANITDSYWSVTSNWGNVVVIYIDATDMQLKPLVFQEGVDTANFNPSPTARQNTWVLHSVIVQDNDGGDYPIPSSAISGGVSGYNIIVQLLEFLYVPNNGSNDVAEYSVNLSNGQLAALSPSSVSSGSSPSAVAINPSHVYAYVGNSGATTISQYSINQSTGVLSSLSPPTATSAANTGFSPMSITPNGQYAYAVSNVTNDVYMYSIGGGGQLTALSPATIPAGNGAYLSYINSAGTYLYVTNITDKTVSQYSIDGGTGQLTPLSPATVACGAFPFDFVFSPSGNQAYVVNLSDATISQYSISAGQLSPLSPATISTGTQPAGMIINSAGTYMYAAIFGTGNVDTYSIDPTTHQLSFSSTISCGGQPRNVVLSSNGAYAYVPDWQNGVVFMFSVNESTGVLTALSPSSISTGGTNPIWATIANV